jgi:hypothetical protein
MQEKGGPSTEVDVYDPQSDSWTKGPALFGPPLEGFGSTAFEIGGKLLVVTRSGAVQQLADDGKSWHIAGQVKHPRFFARLLPIADHRAILIGGADMESGKTLEVEVLARE